MQAWIMASLTAYGPICDFLSAGLRKSVTVYECVCKGDGGCSVFTAAL